jgi:acyl-CoA synthetase (NDP forming)
VDTGAGLPLAALFEPRSVAVVGASGNPQNFMSRALGLLVEQGYAGTVYAVNPRYDSIGETPCYPSLSAIPDKVDLAVISVPADQVPGVIAEAPQVGASAAVILSAGFAEDGEAGSRRQEDLVAAAGAAGVRLVGPNCQGVMYAPSRLFATFTPAAEGAVQDTGFAFVGQSGALGGYLMATARASGLGMTAWATVGNQADLTTSEVASALLARDEVKVLAMYLESIADPGALVEMAGRANELDKPVVLLAGGQSTAGWRAAMSHTGALVRPDAALATTARRLGITVVQDLDELHDASYTLLRSRRGAGPRIGALSTSGGAGGLIADHVERAGLLTTDTSAELKAELSRHIPSYGSVENPIDVTPQLFTGDGKEFGEVVRLTALAPDFDQIVIVVTQLGGVRGVNFANALVAVGQETAKPVHVCWLADAEFSRGGREILRDHSIQVHASIHAAVAAARRVAAPRPAPLPAWEARPDPRFAGLPETVSHAQASELLDAARVPQPRAALVDDPAVAADAVQAVGGLAVLKVQAPGALHKTEAGLVRLGVTPQTAATVAAELLASAGSVAVEGILVQEQISPGFELLIGISRRSAGLPPVLTVGAGGVTAEVWEDVVSRPLPVTGAEVAGMLSSLKSWKLLAGFRGHPGYDTQAAAEAVVRLATAAELVGERLIELEVNPLIVHERGGSHVADFLLRLLPEGTRQA